MWRRYVTVVVVAVAFLAITAVARAEVCYLSSATLQASQWLQTGYGRAGRFVWNGQSGKGYTAERMDSGNVIVYFQNVGSGGVHVVDLGLLHPWSKMSFYNWYNNSNVASVGMTHTDGPCF
jgi:hypothetical protein